MLRKLKLILPIIFIFIVLRLFTQPVIFDKLFSIRHPLQLTNIPIALWMIVSEPILPKNVVPFPSSYQVNHFPPWRHYERYWGPVKNGAMPDIISQIYPWRYFAIKTIKEGQLPLWNPYNFSGNPHLANFQSAVLSPFNLLFFILPFVDAWSIIVFLQPLLGGIFLYLFMKELKVSNVGSLLSSITFMFCGFMVVWMAYATLSLAISFLPLSLFAIEKFINTKKIRWAILLSLSIPLSLFSGHFQTSLYFASFVLVYLIFRSFSKTNKGSLFLLLLYFISGILLTMPQVIPSIELYLNSVRSELFITEGGIPLQYLVTIFSPDFFGNPVTRNDWVGNYAEWASFIGIIPLLLAIFATFKRQKITFFFLIAGVTTLIFAIESPIHNLLSYLKIPVLSTSNPSRIIVLSSFSLAVLAGIGLDNLKGQLAKNSFRKIIIILLLFTCFISIIWLLLLFMNILGDDKLLIAKRNMILPSILFMLSSIVIISSKIFKKLSVYAMFCLLLISSFDSLRFANKWVPYDPKDLVFQELPFISTLKKTVGNSRYFGNLGTEVSTYYGIGSVEGYDPLYIATFGNIATSTFRGNYQSAQRSVAKLSRTGDHVDKILDLLGVSVIFHPIADTNQGWAYPVWKNISRHEEIYRNDRFQLFRNKEALPKAFFYYDYEVLNDKRKIINRIHDADFDIKKTLILEENIDLRKNNGKGNATILKYTPNIIDLEVETNTEGLMFLSDNYYPGWKALIDKNETEILRANYSFRAIVVPAGHHKVEFLYDPMSFRWGIYLAGIGILSIMIVSKQISKKM